MPGSVRPSDIYGPPEQPRRRIEPGHPTADAEPGRRRVPLLVGLGILALVVVGLLVAPDGLDGQSGLVDVALEEEAIAALSLFATEAETHDRLTPGDSLYAPPGPDTLARIAAEGGQDVRDQLGHARRLPPTGSQAQRYWTSPAHDALLARLRQAEDHLELVSHLAAVHATFYDGAGLVPMPQGIQELQSRLATGAVPEPLRAWSHALLAESDGVDAEAEATQHRAQTDEWWAEHLHQLAPVEVEVLAAYVETLSAPTIRGIEGHPVAGPALERLTLGS